MKRLIESQTIDEALETLNAVINKINEQRTQLKDDSILISNLHHDLDVLLHYKVSQGRETK